MILASIGIKKTEKQLSKMLKPSTRTGTDRRQITHIAEKYRLNYVVKRDASVSDIREYVRKGWKVIVCYKYGGISHYSLVKRVTWHSIYFLDPAAGPKHRYLIPNFRRKWNCGKKERKSFIAIKKP